MVQPSVPYASGPLEVLGDEYDITSTFLLSVNPVDGSCWTTDAGQVVHLSANNRELWRGGNAAPTEIGWVAIGVNPADGSCWTADGTAKASGATPPASVLLHWGSEGSELWGGGSTAPPQAGWTVVAVNPADGSCWAAGSDGAETPTSLTHFSKEGVPLSLSTAYDKVDAIAVDPNDGSCWISSNHTQLVHLAANGDQLSAAPEVGISQLAVDPSDGSCWLATNTCHVVHVTSGGAQEVDLTGRLCPWFALNPVDGTCWVIDRASCATVRLQHVDASGNVLAEYDSLTKNTWDMELNPADGSLWIVEEPTYDSTTKTYSIPKILHLGVHAVTAFAAANPTTVTSGGTCSLAASAVDNEGLNIATWAWSDGAWRNVLRRDGPEPDLHGSDQHDRP